MAHRSTRARVPPADRRKHRSAPTAVSLCGHTVQEADEIPANAVTVGRFIAPCRTGGSGGGGQRDGTFGPGLVSIPSGDA